MHLAAHLAALVAVMSTGVVYGTDAFCALVQRPALARVDDATLTAVMGNVHRFGDRRLPVPGILGLIAAAAASVCGALADRPAASATAGGALALLLVWPQLTSPRSPPAQFIHGNRKGSSRPPHSRTTRRRTWPVPASRPTWTASTSTTSSTSQKYC